MGSKQELTKKLNEIESYIRTNPQEASNHFYSFLETASNVGSELLRNKGSPGWSKNVTTSSGAPLFSDSEQKEIETYITIPSSLNKVQLGGALLIPGGVGDFLHSTEIPFDPRDISIDAAFFKLKNFLDESDFKFKEIAGELGIVDLINEGPDLKGVIPMPPPIPPIPWYIPRRLFIPLASTFVEYMRIWISIVPIDFTLFRFWLSLIQTFLDSIRGDLKQAIFSSLGLFSKGGLRIGIAGRFVVNLLSFVSPDLQEQFAVNLFKTSKSFAVGIVLWLFSVAAPDALRMTVSQSFELAKTTVEQFNEKIIDVEKQVDAVAGKAGLKVTFPRLPIEFVPTLDDIQNIQMLARNPQVFCSPQFQAIVEPLKMIPPLRFVLDMLNIPTVQEDIDATCKGVDSSSIEAAVKQWATPNVEIVPGGPANQAMKAKQMLENPQAALGALAGQAGLPMNKLGDLQSLAANPTGALTSLAGQAGLPMDQLGKLGDLQKMAANPTDALSSLAGQAGLPVNELKQAKNMAKKLTKKGGRRKLRKHKTYRKKA